MTHLKFSVVWKSIRRWNSDSRRFVLLIMLIGCPIFARSATPPVSGEGKAQALANVQQLVLPPTDVAKELAADPKAEVAGPLRYASPSAVQVTPATHGTWEQLPDGRLWRLRVVSTGATDLNMGFTTFWLPEGATLHVIAENADYFQGPFTAQDNQTHGELWTPVTPGEAAVIELFVPDRVVEQPRIVLTQVGLGYRDLFNQDQNLLKSGSCNINVICPSGDAWRNEIRSVARYSISGSGLCTGTLVMDQAADFKNYFLTANHCGLSAGNAASVVVYWNYQSPTCGVQGGGSLSQNQSGATFRAAKADVDFALIELNATPNSSFQVYYAGWDRSGTVPSGAVGIHHPNGDEKAISFSSTPLTTINSCIGTGGSGTHWHTVWSQGVTEPGSSGSGIWDPVTHQLVGTLSGGASRCGGSDLSDCYGKFSVSWGSGTSSLDRLRDWLDPLNTGVTSIAGQDPKPTAVITGVSASLTSEGCSPTNGLVDPGETVTVNFVLRNTGTTNTANLVATLRATNGVSAPSAPQSYGTVVAGGSNVARSFAFTATGTCGATITPTLQLQDGTNNLGTVSFNFTLGAVMLTFSQNFDGVVAPTLPTGWTSAVIGAGAGWSTSTSQRDTLPNSAFAAAPAFINENRLSSPLIPITTANARLTFRHSYNIEAGYDGGVLEISTNGSGFIDILTAGGSFVNNGYNTTAVSNNYSNPLSNRMAWSGNSGGFITTVVTLPPTAVGSSVQLRWRLGTDSSVGTLGWFVDTVSVTDGYNCCSPALVQPLIINARRTGANIAFSYNSVLNQTYIIETKTPITSASWIPLQTNLGNGALQSYTNTPNGTSQRYFRLRTQ